MGRRGKQRREFLIHSLRRKLSSDVIRNAGERDGWSQNFLNETAQTVGHIVAGHSGVAFVAGVFSFLPPTSIRIGGRCFVKLC